MDKKHLFIDPNREPTEMEDLRKKMETRFQEYKNKYLSDFIVRPSQVDILDYVIRESEGRFTRGNGKSGMAIKEDLER